MIKLFNDGKEKHQSWQATLELERHQGMGNAYLNATGYGATREEAIANLKAVLTKLDNEEEFKEVEQ